MSEVATPCLVVDEVVLDANIEAMAGRARSAGLRLRPHVKTHKSLEIARRQVAAGASGLTVATLSEAEAFAAGGFDDLLVAYPLWLSEARAERLARLGGGATVRFGCDSLDSGRHSARLLAGVPVGVLVEVDSGQGRSGSRPARPGGSAWRWPRRVCGSTGCSPSPGTRTRPVYAAHANT